MNMKFGIDQINSPAPKGWRNFERAYMIAFAPGVTAFLSVILTNDRHLSIATASVVFSTAIIKGIGIFMGTGEDYPDLQNKQ
jgi:hypothetical protein